MTSHSNGQEPRVSKGFDSYLDERGPGKAKKLVNIAIYRLFHRICVSFGVVLRAILRDRHLFHGSGKVIKT